MGLDPSSWTGWAFGEIGKKPIFGTVKLDAGMSRPEKAAMLEGRIRDLIHGNRVQHVVLEDVFAMTGKKFNMTQQKLLHSLRAAIEGACYKEGLNIDLCMTAVMPSSWRKTFGVIAPNNTAKLKKATMERCRDLGWEPTNDHEGDALGLWAYGESLFEPGIGLMKTPLFATLDL